MYLNNIYIFSTSFGRLLFVLLLCCRLVRMTEDKSAFAALIISRRAEEFEALRKQRERLLAERRAQRKIKREIDRRQEFVKRSRAQVEAKVRQAAQQWLSEDVA
jgi:translation initiation factor 3 subunit A